MDKNLCWQKLGYARFAWLLLLISGCGRTPTLTPGVEIVSTPVPETKGADPYPLVTPISPSPTPTLVPLTPTLVDPTCVALGDPGFLTLAGFEDLPEDIQAYLNRGATPEQLDGALYDRGVASLPSPVVSGDMTGDGKTDLAVAIFDPTSSFFPPGGKLLIFTCHDGAYRMAYERDTPEFFGSPHLWYLQDLDQDGSADLLFSEPSCGAHTCFEYTQVLSWVESGFENRMAGDSGDLPSPDIRISDLDGDGIFDLEVVSGGFGSVGAGPQRALTRVWSLDLDSRRWEVAYENLGASDYRIHVLHDAEAAARGGDVEGALVQYQRVIADPSLADWMDPDQERAALGAYARYKMMALYLRESPGGFAEASLEALKAAIPEGSPQFPYVELAEAYWGGFGERGQEGGCAAAVAYAGQHPEAVLEPLGPGVFGYANPAFEPQDMCP